MLLYLQFMNSQELRRQTSAATAAKPLKHLGLNSAQLDVENYGDMPVIYVDRQNS